MPELVEVDAWAGAAAIPATSAPAIAIPATMLLSLRMFVLIPSDEVQIEPK
ncbi:hypothetical protein [Streptosporangium subroseum]|uniref:hypothetical protein n=1 Tax=Streptosporangium subroseum TaxID=106412 RepID=UPI0015C666C2|nr:hypothetical protein [Streptosporangium subroseum]